ALESLELEPFSWAEVAERLGIPVPVGETVYRYLGSLRRAADARWIGEGYLQGPTEGSLDTHVRHVLTEHLQRHTKDHERLGVGLYWGFGAPEDGPGAVAVRRTIEWLEYGFAAMDSSEFFAMWVTDDLWTDVVAYVWPQSMSWTLFVDPDSTYGV